MTEITGASPYPATALFLAAVAEASGRAFVSVEVFEGGIGALIATCVPPRDPPFVEGRATFLARCDVQGIKPPEGKDWKDLAIASCEREGIVLPRTKAEQRDAAEAVGICTCWAKCEVPNIKCMQDRFMALRTGAYAGKGERQVA